MKHRKSTFCMAIGRKELAIAILIFTIILMLATVPLKAPSTSSMTLGVNYLSSGNAYDDTTNSILTRDFTLFKNNNVTDITIRLVWSAIEGSTRGSYDTRMIGNVKRALGVAGGLGLRVHISLWTHFQEYATWSVPDYVTDPFTGKHITLAIVRSSTMRRAWLDMVSWVVRQIQSYPAIASWQILNEPMYDSSFTAVDQKANFQTLWGDAAQLIESLDASQRPCTVRFAIDDSPWSGDFDLSSLKSLDYVGINVYVDPNDFGRLQWGTWNMVYRAVNDTHARGKEIWFTEFGAWSSNAATQERAYAYTLDVAIARGVDGAFAWAWQSINSIDEPYNICLNTSGSAAPAFYELASRGIPTGVPSVLQGDVNCDARVDIYDAVILVGLYNSVPTSMNWNANADINGDNIVDVYDAMLLASNYGNTA